MRLLAPDVKYKKAFLKLVDDYKNSHDEVFTKMYNEAKEDFEAYVNKLNNHSKGLELPENRVRQSSFWIMDDEDRIVGNLRIRHELKGDFLLNAGGHIGTDIGPSYRLKGYARESLKLGLIKSKELGLSEVIISCLNNNIASIKIIESVGGEYMNSYTFKDSDVTYLKYKVTI